MNRKYYGQAFTPQQLSERRQHLERIEMLSGRPKRNTVIGSEDVCNLLIALHKSTSLEEFLERT